MVSKADFCFSAFFFSFFVNGSAPSSRSLLTLNFFLICFFFFFSPAFCKE